MEEGTGIAVVQKGKMYYQALPKSTTIQTAEVQSILIATNQIKDRAHVF